MDFKRFATSVIFKGADTGSFAATFSTFNVIDRDGDVTLPGAIEDGRSVVIGAYGHASLVPGGGANALPVGEGVIKADETRAWVDAAFFTDTTPGRDTYLTVKRLGPLGEWSYGFKIIDSEPGQFRGQSVRFLKRLDVVEVSPVLRGSGIGTSTDTIKDDGLYVLDGQVLERALRFERERRAANTELLAIARDVERRRGSSLVTVRDLGIDPRELERSLR